jgi:glycosyltransferase involved in cell wall biosynthesis
VNKKPLRILQVTAGFGAGGASKVASNLFLSYRTRGHRSWLMVANKKLADPSVLVIPDDEYRRGVWTRTWISLGFFLSKYLGRIRGAERARNLLAYYIGQPRRWVDVRRGREDFDFPSSRHLLSFLPEKPDILHCHNLHGGYFDLEALISLSQQVPVVLTLHDAWLLSGHCSHSFECERWKIGCGHCPDLSIYPAIKRDATSFNWHRKKQIFARCRLYVATPSEWLMKKVNESILAQAMIDGRIIPNGIDLSIFRPENKKKVRQELGIHEDADILIISGWGISKIIWRDYETIHAAVEKIASFENSRGVEFICLGESAPEIKIGNSRLRFFPYTADQKIVAKYYQAADIYLHATKADTFPNAVIEALACGTPVVAVSVGGIPEQINGLKMGGGDLASDKLNTHNSEGATGILVPSRDAAAMARAAWTLLSSNDLWAKLSWNAVRDTRRRFDLNRQVDDYLDWYYRIIPSHGQRIPETEQ